MVMLSLSSSEGGHDWWPILLFAGVALFMPLLMSRFSPSSGKAEDLLGLSFAKQRPVIHGKETPASSLRVRYRWPSNASGGGGRGVMEMDANWLCQTEGGLFVVAIGQVWQDMERLFPSTALQVRWI